jgi:hypothetical protein
MLSWGYNEARAPGSSLAPESFEHDRDDGLQVELSQGIE